MNQSLTNLTAPLLSATQHFFFLPMVSVGDTHTFALRAETVCEKLGAANYLFSMVRLFLTAVTPGTPCAA